MTTARESSIGALASVAAALGDMKDRVVFVGGTVAALYPLDEAVEVRPTLDVDCIVNVLTTVEYYTLVEELRRRGFAPCSDEGAPLCRHVVRGVRVDVMPIGSTAIGPTNQWYADAMRDAVQYDAAGVSVRALTPVYFVATKLAAFESRGRGDFVASHDLEDLLGVLAGLATLRADIEVATAGVALAVRSELARLAGIEVFRDAVPGHFDGHASGQARARRLGGWLRSLRQG